MVSETGVAARVIRAAVRQELLGPFDSLLGYATILFEEARDRGLGDFLHDLEKIQTNAEQNRRSLDELLRRAADAGDPEETERTILRHELKNYLHRIIGFCELVREDAESTFFDWLIRDVDRIRETSRTCLERIERLLAPPTTDVALQTSHTSELPEMVKEVLHDLNRGLPRDDAEAGIVLIVDDNRDNRELLARHLEYFGHTPVLADGAHEALGILADRVIDLILLDIIMPELNGFQFLSLLKGDVCLRHIPIILISGLDEVQGITRGIDLGAEDYLIKPFNAVMLRARVGAGLEKKRLRDREHQHMLEIERERRRYDLLLHSILPRKVIAELNVGHELKPFRKDDVAVLFADLVGFTSYCGRHTPEEVVSDLQGLIDTWDGIAADHGVEKIKTLGDGFMAACGLLESADDPVGNCIGCGRAMIASARELNPEWNVRVGIHVGPVVAGLLGRRQFLFDIWGDTVNTASRVESQGLAGLVNLSAEAYRRVTGRFPAATRRDVDVRGKCVMTLYAVADDRPGSTT